MKSFTKLKNGCKVSCLLASRRLNDDKASLFQDILHHCYRLCFKAQEKLNNCRIYERKEL